MLYAHVLAQFNGICVFVQVNECCIPAQISGHCIPVQVLHQDKSMSAASLHRSMCVASLHKSMGAASLHKSMGAASLHKSTRSSAQGNCSAKSLAASVMSSILPYSSILPGPPCPPPVMLSLLAGGSGHKGVQPWGGQAAGGSSHGGVCPRGQGTFWSSCHILHYHMVLRPKGTSHNERRQR